MKFNSPIAWFEIVVKDLPKAMAFYQNVFDCTLTEYPACPSAPDKEMKMAIFSYEEGHPGGALVSSKCYDDHKNGPGTTIIYLNVDAIASTLQKVEKYQGKITFPCTSIGENGFIAGFEDLDGNAIGIWSMNA